MSKKNGMIGAIVGDIAGSRFEWHNRKSKQFTFLKGKVGIRVHSRMIP